MAQVQTQTQNRTKKFFVIGRHKFTTRQKKLLEKINLTEEVGRLAKVENVQEVIKQAKESGASAIVVQALPMHLLAQLLSVAQRQEIPVLVFRIEAVATVSINETCPENCDIVIPDPRSGNKRCSRTVAIERIKRISIETETLATI